MSDGVFARAPAHVTAFFAPRRREEPARTGATGAGLALDDGVRVRVRPRGADDGSEPHRVTLNGTETAIPAVTGVLQRVDAPPTRVMIDAAVPVGAGFGVSAGAALGTALAASEAYEIARTTDELVAVAHAAEVEAGTGLGDAVAVARGGVPVRLAAGDPFHGRVDALPARPRIEYVSFGELSTPEVLAGDTSRVTAAGERALKRLRSTPSIRELFAAGRAFTSSVGLADERVREAIEAVTAGGGEATMAMLGRTVLALGTGLSDAGYDPTITRVDPAGVRLVE